MTFFWILKSFRKSWLIFPQLNRANKRPNYSDYLMNRDVNIGLAHTLLWQKGSKKWHIYVCNWMWAHTEWLRALLSQFNAPPSPRYIIFCTPQKICTLRTSRYSRVKKECLWIVSTFSGWTKKVSHHHASKGIEINVLCRSDNVSMECGWRSPYSHELGELSCPIQFLSPIKIYQCGFFLALFSEFGHLFSKRFLS